MSQQLDLLFDQKNSGGEWTPAAIAELIRLVYVEQLVNADIAARTGRTHGAIESAIHRYCRRAASSKPRDCMTCRRAFFSEHSGNRICARCKGSASYTDFDHRFLECA